MWIKESFKKDYKSNKLQHSYATCDNELYKLFNIKNYIASLLVKTLCTAKQIINIERFKRIKAFWQNKIIFQKI